MAQQAPILILSVMILMSVQTALALPMLSAPILRVHIAVRAIQVGMAMDSHALKGAETEFDGILWV